MRFNCKVSVPLSSGICRLEKLFKTKVLTVELYACYIYFEFKMIEFKVIGVKVQERLVPEIDFSMKPNKIESNRVN